MKIRATVLGVLIAGLALSLGSSEAHARRKFKFFPRVMPVFVATNTAVLSNEIESQTVYTGKWAMGGGVLFDVPFDLKFSVVSRLLEPSFGVESGVIYFTRKFEQVFDDGTSTVHSSPAFHIPLVLNIALNPILTFDAGMYYARSFRSLPADLGLDKGDLGWLFGFKAAIPFSKRQKAFAGLYLAFRMNVGMPGVDISSSNTGRLVWGDYQALLGFRLGTFGTR